MKILHVEDEIEIAELTKTVLEENGITALSAKTRAEAIFKINNQKFDYIFLDIKLGSSDAIPVLKEIKAKKTLNPDTPIILYSGHVSADILKEYRSVIKKVYVKPVEVQQILDELEISNTEFSKV